MTSRRARLWLMGLVAAGLVTLALVVGGWLTWRAWVPGLARAEVERALTAALRRPVRVGAIVLRPWLGRAAITDIEVAAGQDWADGTAATVRRVEAVLGLASLWRREVVLARLVAEDVDATLQGGGEGHVRLPAPLPERVSLGLVSVTLRSLVVRRARVTWTRPSGDTVEIAGLDATAWPGPGATTVEAAARRVAVRMGRVDEVVEALEGTGRLEPGAIAAGALHARWRHEAVAVEGRLPEREGRLQLELRGRATVPLDRIAAWFGLGWRLEGVAAAEATLSGPVQGPDLEARLTVPAIQVGPVAGARMRGTVRWRERTLAIAVAQAEALGGRVAGSLVLRPGTPGASEVEVEARTLSLERLDELLRTARGEGLGVGGTVTGAVSLRGDLRRPREGEGRLAIQEAQVTLPGSPGRLGPVAVTGQARLSGGGVEVEGAEARWSSGRLAANGRVGLDGTLALRASAEGELGPIAALRDRTDVAGTAAVAGEVRGRWDAPLATGRLQAWRVAVGRARADRVDAPFTYRDRAIRLAGAEAALGRTRVQGGGEIRLAPGPVVTLEVAAREARAEDLAPWLPPAWPAAGAFTLAARLSADAGGWRASGTLDAVDLRVRDHALAAVHLPFAADTTGVTLRRLRLRARGIPVTGDLTWGWAGTGDATLEVGPAALASLPGVPERLALAGVARGRVRLRLDGSVTGRATLALEDLAVAGHRLGPGRLEATVQDGALSASLALPESRLDATGRGRLAPGESLAIQARAERLDLGPIAERWLPAGARAGVGPLAATVSGTADLRVPLSDPTAAEGTITAELAALRALGEDWTARGPVTVQRRAGALRLEGLSLASRLGRIDARASLAGSTVDAHADLAGIDLGRLGARWMPERVAAALGEIQGSASGVVDARVPLDDPWRAEGTLALAGLRIVVAGDAWAGGGPVTLEARAGTLSLRGLELGSRLGTVTAAGTLARPGDLRLAVRGRMPLSLLPVLRPEVREAEGLVDLTLRASGPLTAPDVAGEGTVQASRLALREVREPIREVRGRFTVSPGRVQLVHLSAAVGEGTVSASGELALDGFAPRSWRLTTEGRQVPVHLIPHLESVVDADVQILGTPDRTVARGDVRLRRGVYARDFSLLLALLEPRAAATAPREGGLQLDIRVRLRNNLVVRSTLARLRADGTLAIQGTTARPVVFGTLEAGSGQLSFRGQTYRLASATARFTDPRRIDPYLDVHATTQIREWEVRMHLTGRAENPEVRFSSTPPLPSEDVLSLVAFGATRGEVERSGGVIALGEAAKFLIQDLLGGGAGGLVGLDVQGSDTDSEGAAALLAAGTRLTRRATVSYRQGVENATERRLRVEYDVAGPLVIAGEQDFRGGYGADVILRLRFR